MLAALAVASAACADVVEDARDAIDGDQQNGAGNGGVALDDRGSLGALGPALLTRSTRRAVVEIDTTGRDMTGRARNALAAALQDHGRKRDVSFTGSADVEARDTYTDDDLRRLSEQHRSVSSQNRRVTIHVLVLEGRHENGDALGVAFDASSFAIFPDRIGSGVLSGLSYDRFEEAVVVHELGHLFGLVNITGEGGFHEDPERPGHSENRDSVMFWAVEDVSVGNVFRGGPPTEFDSADEREMRRIRG